MRHLFKLGSELVCTTAVPLVRPSVRAIIIQNKKLAMVYSCKYGYYKFPGGGVEPGEAHLDTLIREVSEEVGLEVIPATMREYGCVHRVQLIREDTLLLQDNYYYFCDVEMEIHPQHLDAAEAQAGFQLVFTDPYTALKANRSCVCCSDLMIEREAKVLELLIEKEVI